MEKVAGLISKVSDAFAYIAGAATLCMLALILGEIFCRTFLNTSLLLTVEISGWLLVFISFVGAGWTLKEGGHVQVKMLSSHLPLRRQHLVEICIGVVALVYFSWLALRIGQAFVAYFLTRETTSTIFQMPVWWAWAPMFIGTIVFALQSAGLIIQNIVLLDGSESDEPVATMLGANLWLFLLLGMLLCGLLALSIIAPPDSWQLVLAIIFILIFALIGSSLWISVSLMITGTLALVLFTSVPVGKLVPLIAFSANDSFILACLPLFIFMGEMLYFSGASEHLYSGISLLAERIPGGLLHSNILACTMFAAISGSSPVTTATIGSIAIPELEKRGYSRRMALGSLAGAGTLGLLIPPSTVLIVYGAITNQSIGQLFIGGVLPGLVISALFLLYIGIVSLRDPSLAPTIRREYSLKEMMKGTAKVLPVVGVMGLVLGLIYLGITTPTEAGAIGALCAVVLTALYKNLNWHVMRQSLFATIRTTCMIMFILTGAFILSSAIAYIGIPQALADSIAALNVSKWVIFAILCFIYLGLGSLFEGASMMVLTLPIVFPLMLKLGFDPIWFGIVITILIEAAQITPPVGFNLYVIQNISGEAIGNIVRYSFPFFLILILGILILALFPEIALFLPKIMIRTG